MKFDNLKNFYQLDENKNLINLEEIVFFKKDGEHLNPLMFCLILSKSYNIKII